MADVAERGATGVLFRNETLDFLASWLLGYAQQGGLSPGAVLAACARVRDGDPAGWVRAFTAAADAAAARAMAAASAGWSEVAATEWLGASVARGAALALADPRTADAAEARRAREREFRAFLAASGSPWETWQIPFGERHLPAYWTQGAEAADRLVIVVGGGDTSVEDLWFFGGRAYREAGWPVVAVDLPGQGATPEQGLHFGPETLAGLRRVFEAVRARGCAGEVLLLGWSGGGIFVTKYASLARPEDRLRAVVASAPVHDAERLFREALPRVLRGGESSPLVRLAWALARRNRVFAASLRKYSWQFGPGGIAGVVTGFGDLGRTDLTAIDVPVLALVGAAEDAEGKRQAREVVAAVRPRHPLSDVIEFDAASGASAHCQVGNLPLALARCVAWSETVFGASMSC